MGLYCTEIDHILQDLPHLPIKIKYKGKTCHNLTSSNTIINGCNERGISFMARFDSEGAMQCDTNDVFGKTNLRNNIKQRIKLS